MKEDFEKQLGKINTDYNEVSKASLGDSKALTDKIAALEIAVQKAKANGSMSSAEAALDQKRILESMKESYEKEIAKHLKKTAQLEKQCEDMKTDDAGSVAEMNEMTEKLKEY